MKRKYLMLKMGLVGRQDDEGAINEELQNYGQVWCSLEPREQSTNKTDGTVKYQTIYDIECNYLDGKDITPNTVLRYCNCDYYVQSAIPQNKRTVEIVAVLHEKL